MTFFSSAYMSQKKKNPSSWLLLYTTLWQQNITSFLFMSGHKTGKCSKIVYVVQDIPVRNHPKACFWHLHDIVYACKWTIYGWGRWTMYNCPFSDFHHFKPLQNCRMFIFFIFFGTNVQKTVGALRKYILMFTFTGFLSSYSLPKLQKPWK